MTNKELESLKYQWSKEYLTSDDFKNFLKQAILPPVIATVLLIAIMAATFLLLS